MNIRVLLPVISVFLISSATDAFAQAEQVSWQQMSGPYGGNFVKFAIDPYTENIWTVTYNGTYVSSDQGETWAQSPKPRFSVRDFAFHKDGTIFAGVYRTTDQGKSWTKTAFPDSIRARQLAVDVLTGNVVMTTLDGIFLTTDNGSSWNWADSTLLDDVWSLGDGRFWGRTGEDNPQLLASNDGGISWQLSALPNGEAMLSYLGEADGFGYAMTIKHGSQDTYKLYRTTAYGANWEVLNSSACFALELLGFTTNGELIVTDGVTLNRFSPDFQRCEIIFEDYERTTLVSRSYRSLQAYAHINQDQLLVFTGYGELFKSIDGGDTWQRMLEDNVNEASVYSFLVDEQTNTVWAGADQKGLFRSVDPAQNWSYLDFSSQNISKIFNGHIPGSYWVHSKEHGLFYSEDYGASWENKTKGSVAANDFFYHRSTHTLYAFSRYDDIYYSENFGESWIPMNAPYASNTDPPLIGMFIDEDNTVYATIRDDIPAGSSGIYRTADKGLLWEKINSDFPKDFYGKNHFLKSDADILWMSDSGGLYASKDNGVGWELSLKVEHGINALIETPDGSLWVGHDTGLLRSHDGGKTWQEELTQLETPCVLSLAWNPQSSEVYVGTHRLGAYQGVLESVKSVVTESGFLSEASSPILGHYPNPSHGSTTVTIDLDSPTNVSLSLYDPLGRKVRDLLKQYLSIGIHHFTFDLQLYSQGLYIYRLETDAGVYNKSLILRH